jgi:phosphoglycerol transferase MdoB-like AlkP superfamily enzyme
VIWEGCPGAFVEAVGGEPDVTPNLNRLANEGVVFTNCYANSYRTDRGVLCTLSGWLGMPTASLMKMTDKSSNLPAIAESLGAFGYKCDFWYGGDVGFTNMNSYLYESGYKTVRGDMYFSAEDRNYSKWGVPDHVVLDSVANNIINRKDIDGRWMTTVLTLSSHEPWEVPYQRLDEKKRNSMAYTDDCMGKFVERLKQSPVWNDLLVVVLSDHGIKSNQKQQNSDYEVAHIPMVWIGGAIKEHRVVSSIMAQSDMAATLLGQLDIPHADFIFSRDVMSKTYQCPSAFHTFDNGMTLIDSLGVVTYDNNAKRTIYSELFTGGQMDIKLYENKIKAVLQTVYKDAATR